MPIYNLQYGNSQNAGQLQISGTSAANATFQARPNTNAAWQTITGPTYTPVANGGGTPDAPVAGDTLTMGGNSVNSHSFQGTATYSTTQTPNGYYYSSATSPILAAGDWDAADVSGK